MNNMAISPITGACGAEISGVQINALGNAEFDGIVEALVTHGAVFFRDQNIELDELVAFGRRFGALEVHPIVDGMAHAPEITKVLNRPVKAPLSAQAGIRIILSLKSQHGISAVRQDHSALWRRHSVCQSISRL